MDKFAEILSERKIREAIKRGELDHLSGEGKPVRIENLYFLPPEFKFAYTVLKNGGYLNLDEDDKVQTSSDCNRDSSVGSLNERLPVSGSSAHSPANEEKPPGTKPHTAEAIQERTLNYNIIRDCRRGRY